MKWLIILQLFLPNSIKTPGVGIELNYEQLCPVTQVLTSVPGIPPEVRDKVLLNYGYLGNNQEYAIDLLVPFELGGVISLKNLWPIPYESRRDTLIKKVKLEHFLHALVCENTLTLQEAQEEISDNWIKTFQRYFKER
jgi:hypothetical protein